MHQVEQDSAAANMRWESQCSLLKSEMQSIQNENERLKLELQQYSKENFDLEQKLEDSESELTKMRMQASAQARQIKSLMEGSPSQTDLRLEQRTNVPTKISELTDYVQGLEKQNEEMKKVIEAQE